MPAWSEAGRAEQPHFHQQLGVIRETRHETVPTFNNSRSQLSAPYSPQACKEEGGGEKRARGALPSFGAPPWGNEKEKRIAIPFPTNYVREASQSVCQQPSHEVQKK